MCLPRQVLDSLLNHLQDTLELATSRGEGVGPESKVALRLAMRLAFSVSQLSAPSWLSGLGQDHLSSSPLRFMVKLGLSHHTHSATPSPKHSSTQDRVKAPGCSCTPTEAASQAEVGEQTHSRCLIVASPTVTIAQKAAPKQTVFKAACVCLPLVERSQWAVRGPALKTR